MNKYGYEWKTVDDVLTVMSQVIEFADIGVPNINQKGMLGNTPLKVAVVWDDLEAVELLIRSGADVNALNEDDFTALHHAATHNNEQIIRLLMSAGADPMITNYEGRRPADLTSNELIKKLLEGNA